MRKRNVQILFRLTEEEAEHLNELVRKSGRTKEAFLRENEECRRNGIFLTG